MTRLIETLEERIPKSDNVSQGPHKVSAHVEQPSINKHF